MMMIKLLRNNVDWQKNLNSMSARVNGPIDASTARQMKAKANAEAAETMNNIDYLKNG